MLQQQIEFTSAIVFPFYFSPLSLSTISNSGVLNATTKQQGTISEEENFYTSGGRAFPTIFIVKILLSAFGQWLCGLCDDGVGLIYCCKQLAVYWQSLIFEHQ